MTGPLKDVFGVSYLGRVKASTERPQLDANFAIVVNEEYWAKRQGFAALRPTPANDAAKELLKGSFTDDPAGLTAHWQEHRPRLLVMLQRRIDPSLAVRLDVEDILSETFLVTRRRWAEFPASPLSAYAWLYRLARDCLLEAWRKQKRPLRDLDRAVASSAPCGKRPLIKPSVAESTHALIAWRAGSAAWTKSSRKMPVP